MVLNAIVWVAGMEVPENGVISNAITEDELNANLDVYPGKENPQIPLPNIEEFQNLPPAKWIDGADRKLQKAKQKKQREERKRRELQMKKKKAEQQNNAEKSEKVAS